MLNVSDITPSTQANSTTEPSRSDAPRVVDHQTHWLPASYLDALAGRRDRPRARRSSEGYLLETPDGACWKLPPQHTELDEHFADMEAHGVDVMVSSPGIIGEFGGLHGTELHEAADRLNEATAAAQHRYPDRFAGLAVLPMAEPELAVKVLDRAVGELGLRGVCVYSNTGGDTPITLPELLAVYRRIESLDVPLFLHPSTRSLLFDERLSPVVERGLAWLCDTSVAAASLIVDGVLDACPRLTVVHPHLGGVLPYAMGRLSASATVMGLEARPIGDYLRERFYTDSAGDTPGAFTMAAETYGADRILFATDFPFRSRSAMDRKLRDLEDGPARRAGILTNRLPGLRAHT